jgi:ATP-binding cassette subfamily B protein
MIRSILFPLRFYLIAIALCILVAETLFAAPPLIVQKIVDEHLTTGVYDGLLSLAWLYFGVTVAGYSVNGLNIYLNSIAAQRALHSLRVTLFAHLQTLPMSYFDQTPLGDIISRNTADVETIDTLFSSGLAIALSRVIGLVVVVIAIVALSLPLSLLAALVAPPLVVMTNYFRVRVRLAENNNRQAVGLMNTHLQETLGGIEVIRAFRREEAFVARFRRALQHMVEAYNRATFYNSLYPPVMATLSSVAVAILLWSGTSGALASFGISLGTLTAFVLLFRRFFTTIVDLGDDWQTVQSALSGLERIRQVLNEPSEDRGQRSEVQASIPNTQLSDFHLPSPVSHLPSLISLRDVTFGYRDAQPVLHDLSLHVQAGEHVALVGRTGAGKTSTLHLLAGMYAPWAGAVRVAEIDPRALSSEERRHCVGVVPQVVQLFSGTVHDNLTLGDTSVPRETVERAAQLAGADEFIRALPQGYDTPLSGAGRGGSAQLSAGQRQLLALARALVWNPPVLLLDEATSAIDNASDAAFRAALRADATNHQRAVLSIAHRLSTAREADRVVVMEAGRIIEEGSPDELMHRGGRFAALVELETAGWDWQEA